MSPSTSAGHQNNLHADDSSSNCSVNYWDGDSISDLSDDCISEASKNDANGESSGYPIVDFEEIGLPSPQKDDGKFA